MKLRIELDEKTLRSLVYDYLQAKLGDVEFNREDVRIQVKSQQNYKSEWESADFRAVLEKDVSL